MYIWLSVDVDYDDATMIQPPWKYIYSNIFLWIWFSGRCGCYLTKHLCAQTWRILWFWISIFLFFLKRKMKIESHHHRLIWSAMCASGDQQKSCDHGTVNELFEKLTVFARILNSNHNERCIENNQFSHMQSAKSSWTALKTCWSSNLNFLPSIWIYAYNVRFYSQMHGIIVVCFVPLFTNFVLQFILFVMFVWVSVFGLSDSNPKSTKMYISFSFSLWIVHIPQNDIGKGFVCASKIAVLRCIKRTTALHVYIHNRTITWITICKLYY